MAAFKMYVRTKEVRAIKSIKKVQKRFAKRIPVMKNATYCQRLKKLHMESFGVRRLHLDLLHTCKVLIGLVHVSTDDLFIPSDNNSRHGHNLHSTLSTHIANQCAN